MEQNKNDKSGRLRGGRLLAMEVGKTMNWTGERIAALRRLWAEGVSAADIAAALGETSRSAVLGKLHRLKLLGSRRAASAPRGFESEGAAAAEAEPVSPASIGRRRGPPSRFALSPWREEVFQPIAGSQPRPWLQRERGGCAFPVGGDGADLTSCCAPAELGGPYCAAHRRIVFLRGPRLAATSPSVDAHRPNALGQRSVA